MKLVLFRHGEKAFDGSNNPPLSLHGLEQGAHIFSMVNSQALPTPAEIWVSPRLRTQQTMQFLAKKTSLTPVIKEDLDEKLPGETAFHFRDRIGKVIRDIRERSTDSHAAQSLFLCSHLDWIEEFLIQAPSDTDLSSPVYHHWGSAQFMIFDIQDGLFHLSKFDRVEI